MIRLKHRQYPIWINWEGTEDGFNKVKGFVLEDIKERGFSSFDSLVDINNDTRVSDEGGDDAWSSYMDDANYNGGYEINSKEHIEPTKSETLTKKQMSNKRKKPAASKPKGKSMGESMSKNPSKFVE
tara:strand:+ start:2292 stop:2672 length:381 start_codon:yes stop_codon:yes gene_type:complete